MASIMGMADGEFLRPMYCDWCSGLTTHRVMRSMPVHRENLKEILEMYQGEFNIVDDKGSQFVFVTYSCERCKIKIEARRGGQHEHYAIWTVENWNAMYNHFYIVGMKIRKLENTRRRK